MVGTTLDGLRVCERHAGGGELVFLGSGGDVRRRVAKSYSAMYANASGAYLKSAAPTHPRLQAHDVLRGLASRGRQRLRRHRIL